MILPYTPTRVLLIFALLMSSLSELRFSDKPPLQHLPETYQPISHVKVNKEEQPNHVKQVNKNASTHESKTLRKFTDVPSAIEKAVRMPHNQTQVAIQTDHNLNSVDNIEPDDRCKQDPNCYGSYLTYKIWAEKVQFSNKLDIIHAVIGTTILAEYWVVVDQSSRIIHYTSDGTSLRQLGKEAIARNLYEACGDIDVSQQYSYSDLYRFLSGFSPWISRQCGNDACSTWVPSEKYADHKSTELKATYDKFLVNKSVNKDVAEILNYDVAKTEGWNLGAMPNRPWQWLNMDHAPAILGYDQNSEAILYVDVVDNTPAYKFAVFFTFYQTYNR